MPGIPKSVRRTVMALTEKQRARLAHELIVSLDGPPESGVEEAWAETIRRRIAEVREGKAKLVPWDKAMAHIDKVLARRRRR